VKEFARQGSPRMPGSGGRAKFPRTARLLRHSDFDRVYKQGKRHFAAHMTVFYLRRISGGGPRIGFTLGKVVGTAVERNRVKRRLRETVRLHRLELMVPVDVVIHPKKTAIRVEFSELEKEVRRAFELVAKSVRKAT